MRRMAVSMALIPLIVVLAGTVLAGAGASQTPASSQSAYKIEEERFGPVYNSARPPVVSKDGRHVAYVTRKGNKSLLVVDGKSGPEYDGINSRTVAFSPDGKRVACVARKGRKHLVVVNGQPGPEYVTILSTTPIFSPDSKRVAYVALKSTRYLVVVDPPLSPGDSRLRQGYAGQAGEAGGKGGPRYGTIDPRTLIFSPDGKRVAYVAQKNSRYFVVVDPPSSPGDPRLRQGYAGQAGEAGGKPGPGHSWIGRTSLGFSPDSKRVVYVGSKYSARAGGESVLFVDGKPQPESADINPQSLIISPDGKRPSGDVPGGRMAFMIRKGTKRHVVVDGKGHPEYGHVDEHSLIFSPDGKRLAYAVGKMGTKTITKWFAVVDGKPQPEYDDIGKPKPVGNRYQRRLIFSPDGKRVAYVAKRGSKYLVVVDGKPGPEYRDIVEGSPLFSPDGKRVAYAAMKPDKLVFAVVDGIPGPGHDGIDNHTLVFSPDGKRVAYAAKKGRKWLLVVDPSPGDSRLRQGYAGQAGEAGGKGGPEYDRIRKPVFSPDGKRVAYVAQKGNWGRGGVQIFQVVVDGQPGPVYDEIVTRPTFHADGRVEYLAVEYETLLRVKHVPVAK